MARLKMRDETSFTSSLVWNVDIWCWNLSYDAPLCCLYNRHSWIYFLILCSCCHHSRFVQTVLFHFTQQILSTDATNSRQRTTSLAGALLDYSERCSKFVAFFQAISFAREAPQQSSSSNSNGYKRNPIQTRTGPRPPTRNPPAEGRVRSSPIPTYQRDHRIVRPDRRRTTCQD